jgi:transcriptional regulator with XRE-family HTH domain
MLLDKTHGQQVHCHPRNVATIRSALSLQIKELAEAVHVERPTVYSWINGRNTPQPSNRERLHAIFHLAQRWTQLTNKPLGKALHAVGTESKSLFTLMREDPIPTVLLRERFRATARAVDREPSEDPTSVRQLASKHNFDLSRVADRQDDIDLETGKRIFAD